MPEEIFSDRVNRAVTEDFVSVRGAAFWTKLWLGAVVVSRLAAIGLNTAEIILISFVPETVGEALLRGRIDIGGMPGGGAQIAVIFASGILLVLTVGFYCLSTLHYLRWQYQAYANVAALTTEPRFFSQLWSLGIWFVPLANLLLPFWVVRELWRKSDPDVGLAEIDPVARPMQFVQARQSLVTVWWVLCLLMLAARWWSWDFSRRSTDLGDWALACWFEISTSALAALAAGWGIRVVREITERQEERFQNLRLWQQRQKEKHQKTVTAESGEMQQ